MTPFGPQLIGETEKTLSALLRRYLEGYGLTEAEWVTLRVADILDSGVDADGLAATVADRAHFADAANIVRELTSRGLLVNGELTTAARDLITDVQVAIAAGTAPIWDGLREDDIAAATRLLNEVIKRGRAVLASEASLRSGHRVAVVLSDDNQLDNAC
jgi:hypothetical protein